MSAGQGKHGMADDGARAVQSAVGGPPTPTPTPRPRPGAPVCGGSIAELADRLSALVAELVACSVVDLVEPEASRVHGEVHRAVDALGIVAARVLARVEADGRWATTPAGRGARDFDDWLTAQTNGSRAGARRQTRLARAVGEESVPGLAEAVAGGGVSLEHADVLTRLGPTTPARREALCSGDPDLGAGFLLAQAAGLPVGEFAKEVKRWAAKVDPGADERGHRDATARTSCVLSPRDDGVAISGFMTAVDGAAFDTALKAVAGVPAAGDERTHEQRMGAALGQMARIVLDQGLAAGSSGGFRPHLSVHVSLETLVAQVEALASTQRAGHGARGAAAYPSIPPGWEAAVLADGTPIPASVLARLACDSEVSRVVFGPDSQVLDVGRAERLYTRALRRAVIARDRHCSYPGCFQPPTLSEVHHVRHWAAHGGETSVANGVLLCWHHHDVVHSRFLRLHRDHTRGRWDFTEADGAPIPHPGDRAEAHPTREGPAAAGAGAGSGPPRSATGDPPGAASARSGTGPPQPTNRLGTSRDDHGDTLFDVA